MVVTVPLTMVLFWLAWVFMLATQNNEVDSSNMLQQKNEQVTQQSKTTQICQFGGRSKKLTVEGFLEKTNRKTFAR
jgi:hypothetical protein